FLGFEIEVNDFVAILEIGLAKLSLIMKTSPRYIIQNCGFPHYIINDGIYSVTILFLVLISTYWL
ncbi:hypothetical protein WKT02_14375, partial [Erysipelotrichaceae bacterium HCN-30851]